jgi:DNA-binding transcriptional MerR regulator
MSTPVPTAGSRARARAAAPSRAEPRSASGGPIEYFRSRDVVQILGVSRRQLQYWAQTDLVEPSARTPGGHHRYTFEDLVALKATVRLIEAGVSVQKIRKSIRALRALLPSVKKPLAELVLVATGDVVLVFRGETAFEAVSGQEWVFEVALFQREVQNWRRETGKRGNANEALGARNFSGPS